MAPHGVRFHRRRVNDRVPTLAELEQTLAAVTAQIPDDDTSLTTAFATVLGEGYAGDPAYLRIATSTAGSPATASARFNVARAESARIDGAGRVVGGNQRIALTLADQLGARVRLGTAVAGIATDSDGVTLTTQDGEQIAVDRAVVAVPLALVDSIEWRPGFPSQWTEGLDRIETGTAVKLSVPTTRRVRPDGVQHPTFAWWSWNSLDLAGDTGVPAVSCFAGGPTAREWLEVTDGPATWLRHLTRCAATSSWWPRTRSSPTGRRIRGPAGATPTCSPAARPTPPRCSSSRWARWSSPASTRPDPTRGRWRAPSSAGSAPRGRSSG